MLAGCLGWPGSRGPEAGVAGRGAYPIQLHQQSELHGAGPSTALHFCSKPVVVCSSLSCSFCPPRIPLLWTEQGWDDAKTCAGQLELELAAQVLQFLGPVGRGVSHSFTLCSLFCSSSLLRDLLPFSSPQGFVFGFFFFFFSLSAFLCGWSWQE